MVGLAQVMLPTSVVVFRAESNDQIYVRPLKTWSCISLFLSGPLFFVQKVTISLGR